MKHKNHETYKSNLEWALNNNHSALHYKKMLAAGKKFIEYVTGFSIFSSKAIDFFYKKCHFWSPDPYSLYVLGRDSFAKSRHISINISSVVEFQRWWVLKSKIFAMWWPGFQDFIWFFEMEEHGSSEAHKNEFLNYEVLKI